MNVTEKKLKQLYLLKKLLFLTIIAYIIVFIVMNTSYLSVDNLRRFVFSAKTALTQTSVSRNDVITYETGETPIFAPFKDGFAVLGSSSLTVYSKENIKFSVHKTGFRNPVMRVSDGFILCYDRGGKVINVYNSFDLLFTKEFDEIIINANVDASGNVAVLTEKYGYKGQLTVFNSAFEECFNWFSADTYLIDTVFSGANIVSVVTVVQSMENISTVVYTFNTKSGGEKTHVTEENVIPLAVAKKNDGSTEVVSETGLVSFRSGESKYSVVYGLYTPYKFFQSDKYTVIAYDISVQNDIYSIITTDIAGNKLFETTAYGVRAVSVAANTVFVLTSDKLIAYDRTGTVLSETEIEEGMTGIVAGKQKTVIYGANTAYIIPTGDFIK